MPEAVTWDVFISHAWEDKAAIADPLAKALRFAGLRVWYDDFTLTIGDSLSQSINRGLGGSRYGIVILSPSFFAKSWPQMELNGLTARESAAGKIILPVWHHIDRAGVLKYSPILADKLAVSTDRGLDAVVREILEVFEIPAPESPERRPVARPATPSPPPARRRYRVLGGAIAGLLIALAVLVPRFRSTDDATDTPDDIPTERSTTLPRNDGTAERPGPISAIDAGDYATAWKESQDEVEKAPGKRALVTKREDVAMQWLDNIRITGDNAKFDDVVTKVWPALSEGATKAKGPRAGDLLAHMGWGEFLRSRDGVGGLDPTAYYRRALEADPSNPYAHAMWGHWILWHNDSMTEAQTHFNRALQSGRARDVVRNLQLTALTLHMDPRLEQEAVRVANEMRGNGEVPPTAEATRRVWSKYWNIYYDRLLNGNDREAFLSILPGADHLATFRWLFPEDQVPSDKRMLHRLFLATLQDQAGDRMDARASLAALEAELNAQKILQGTIRQRTEEAIRRLR